MFEEPEIVSTLAGNVEVWGQGTVSITSDIGGSTTSFTVDNTFFLPGATRNLLSYGQLIQEGIKPVSKGKVVVLQSKDTTVGRASLSFNNILMLENIKFVNNSVADFAHVKSGVSVAVQHARMAHVNEKRIKDMKKNDVVHGLHIKAGGEEDLTSCIGCKVGKSKALPHKLVTNKNYQVGDLVVADYKGPMETTALDGSTAGLIVFKDVASRHAMVYPVSSKAQALDCFKSYVAWFKSSSGKDIKRFRSDQGREFCNRNFDHFLEVKSIVRETTGGYSPESNGHAESHFRILGNLARAMLAHAGLGKEFWMDAYATANYVYNRVPSAGLVKTPHELMFGIKPTVDHLRIFGCQAVYFVPSEKRRALDMPGVLARFVRYSSSSSTYILWDGMKYIETRDVSFNESVFKWKEQDNDENDLWYGASSDEEYEDDATVENESDSESGSDGVSAAASDSADLPVEPADGQEDMDPVPAALESDLDGVYWNAPIPDKRLARSVNEANYAVYDEHLAFFLDGTPRHIREAFNGPDSDKWKAAVQTELDALEAAGTFKLIRKDDVPSDTAVIDTTWVFAKKAADGSVERYKARLCARGDMQQEVVNYNEVFAPVVRAETVKTGLTLIAADDLYSKQFDFSSAYLNAVARDIVYVRVPHGMVRLDGQDVNSQEHYLLVQKCLYGLRGSGHDWNVTLDKDLRHMGFRRMSVDWCFYVKRTGDTIVYLLLYVDDGIVTLSHRTSIIHMCTKVQIRRKKREGEKRGKREEGTQGREKIAEVRAYIRSELENDCLS